MKLLIIGNSYEIYGNESVIKCFVFDIFKDTKSFAKIINNFVLDMLLENTIIKIHILD